MSADVAAVTRTARSADLDGLRALDRLCFPPGDVDRAPASPGEFEEGIQQGRVEVTVLGDLVIAFAQFEEPTDRHLYVGSLAVHPEHRGRGFATEHLERILARTAPGGSHEGRSVSTVVSPVNLPMLRLVLSHGFVARTYLTDYFGPGRHRLLCQLKVKAEYVDPDATHIVPVRLSGAVESLLDVEQNVITAVVSLPDGPAFEVSRFEPEDFAALQSDETAAGVAFSSGMLAAITFLLGFSFASSRFPDGVRVLLMGGALCTTISLIIYANTSGELARLRANVFGRYTKWGNALSEFGGVYPFLISLPVTFGQVAGSWRVSIPTAAIFSVALTIYDWSDFSIASRFRRTPLLRVLSVLVTTAPLTGAFVVSSALATWIWLVVVSVVLALQGGLHGARRPMEAGPGEATGTRRFATRR